MSAKDPTNHRLGFFLETVEVEGRDSYQGIALAMP
jgi:hypothetical protein